MKEKEMALSNLIYKVRTGSKVYGTNIPESDDDYCGIFIPNKDYVVGIHRCDQAICNQDNKDGSHVDYTIYSLPKFFKLAIDNNPNIAELFFIPEYNILFNTEFGKRIREAYPLFISKKSYHTFKGYAYSQLHKMENKKPEGKRKESFEKYGYDLKFASHLVRLLLEGLEILVEGKITLPLPQNNLVRDIKIGKYTCEEVKEKARELEALVDKAYVTSQLQYSADIKAVNKLQIELLEDFWKQKSLK